MVTNRRISLIEKNNYKIPEEDIVSKKNKAYNKK